MDLILITESLAGRRVINKRSSDRKFDSRRFDVFYSWRSSAEEIFVRFFVHGVLSRNEAKSKIYDLQALSLSPIAR